MIKNRIVLIVATSFLVGVTIGLLRGRSESNEKKPIAERTLSPNETILPVPTSVPILLSEDWHRLQSQETIKLSEEQFTQLVELQDDWYHAIGWMSETVQVDLESLGIGDEHNAEVGAVLTELRDAFRKEDMQRLEHSADDVSTTVSVPAYPEVGRQLVKDMIAALSEILESDKAKILIPVVKRAMATPTSNFGKESKQFVITPRDDGRVHVKVFIDGKPNGSLLAYEEMPLKWNHLTSFPYPTE